MIIIFGLGNPGKKFEKTRHNLGFQIIDKFLKKNRKLYNFSNFNLKKELSSLISEGSFNNQKIILVKPQTFMNLSGKAVKSLIKMYSPNNAMAKLSEYLWVVHDEIDLPLGKIKISVGRGAAGNKGVESIIKELGRKDFVRFRVGICPKIGKPKNLEKFVLQKFNKKEEKTVKEMIKKTTETIEFAIKEGIEKTMNKFN